MQVLHAPIVVFATVALCLSLSGWSPAAAQPTALTPGTAGIDSTLTQLYRTFSFEKGHVPDWTKLRTFFLDGASIVDPVRDGVAPHAVGVAAFIAGFRDAVKNAAKYREGFGERIVATRIDSFGYVAHAYVTFEGFVPGEQGARTRGVDSIQLILAGEDWKIASFTTQFEQKGLLLPPRFLR